MPPGGANFAKTMLRFGKERSEMCQSSMTSSAPDRCAELLADCTAHALRVAQRKPEVAGLYPSDCLWYNNMV